MPYVYPPAAISAAGTSGSAESILTADGITVQQKMNELDAEIEVLKQDKLILEFID